MEEESCKMESEDDKALLEKNRKRTLKTHAQIEALEKFYNDHKYPTESMKAQLAETIGLTEKQVSGWFCHRRLKDKRSLNGGNHVISRQDWSSGVIQDRGSGQRQDSCGSTKQGYDRNFDTREVESGGLTLQESSAIELTYEHGGHSSGNQNHMDDTSSGSSSSLGNMSCHEHDGPISRYPIPKFPMDVKTRRGPSGYLKVKGRVENSAITAVKRQLGKHYREDGPPLGVEFDPLPPGAFDSSMENAVDEIYHTSDATLPASPEFSEIHRHPKIRRGSEYISSQASRNPNMDRTSYKMPQGSDIPENYVQRKFKQNFSLSNYSAYNQCRRNSSIELPQVSAGDISGSNSRDGYGMAYKKGSQVKRMDSVSSIHFLQPFDVNSIRELEPSSYKYNDVGPKSSKGAYEPSNLIMKGSEYHSSFRQISKDGKAYAQKTLKENQAKIQCKNDAFAPKRLRDEFSWPPHPKKSSMVDNQTGTYQGIRYAAAEMPCSFTEDDGSAQTSSLE